MPKVSIIIPFNNVESYISECLESVLNQTLSDLEVICINDASTDGTLDIVKKYLSNDSRIRLIELPERKGQGYARNRGIEIATGEYIGFVDSDDFVKLDMFGALYNLAKENDNDITMCQAVEYDDVSGQYIQSDYYSLSPLRSFSNGVFSAEDSKQVILDINVALWNKIYKRSYLQGLNEKFPEGFIYEDLPFFFGTYLPAKRVQIVWKDFYVYRINRKNSTMQQFNNKILDRVPMVSLTYEKMKKTQYLFDMKKSLQAWIINDLFHRYSLLKEHYQKEFFFLMKKVFQNLEIEDTEDSFWKRVYHFQGYLLVINNSFEDFNQKVFNEYLDIHKVEDRIRSIVVDSDIVDSKISHVYEEITKNYEYTNELRDASKFEITEVEKKLLSNVEEIKNDVIQQLNASSDVLVVQTDEKISKVYEEITKNYAYTNELRDASKFEITEVEKKLLSNVEETKKIIAEKYVVLYENLKDLSYVVYDDKALLLDKISDLNKAFEEKTEYDKNEIKEILNQIQNEFNTKVLSKQKETQKEIENITKRIKENLAEIILKIETSKQEIETNMLAKEVEFIHVIEEQAKRHDEEIALLKEQLVLTEQRLNEKLETPLKKLQKYFANRK